MKNIFNKLKHPILALSIALFIAFAGAKTAEALLCTPVNQGGTGVCTITGLIKGSGTSAFVAATPGTDYLTTLTGPITSSGNATSIASQTGTGTKFVVDNTPTLITPVLGVASATSINKVTITAPASGSTLTISDGKTLTASGNVTLSMAGTIAGGGASQTFTLPSTSDTIATLAASQTFTNKTLTSPILTTPTLGVATATSINGNTFTAGTYTLTGTAGKTLTFSNTLTLAGTDSSTLNIGAGGTLGSNAYTSTAYVPTSTTVAGFALSSNVTLAALTATNSTLTFSGSYTGATARTVGINLANSNTWTANQTITAADASNFVPLIINQNDVTNNPSGMTINNAGTGNSLQIVPTGNTGTSASSSGAFFLNNTSNTGIGANFYTNSATVPTAGLIFAKSDNSSSTGPIFRLDQDGTGPAIKINQNGNTGTTTGSSGGLMVTQNGTGYGAQFYSGVGAGAGALVHIETDNTLWDQPLLEVSTAGTDGGAANIKLLGPAPQIELVETDQSSPAGKFEIGVNGDQFYIAGRNSGNTSFERLMDFNRLASGGGFNLYGSTSGSTKIIPAATASGVLTLPAATDTLVGRATTDTLTNKRITPRIGTETSSATSTPTADSVDQWNVTALAAADAFAAPTGTPTDGQPLTIRIKDNGTARALTWNAIYRASSDLALPSTTVISKTMYLKFIYNAADSKWDFVAYLNNF